MIFIKDETFRQPSYCSLLSTFASWTVYLESFVSENRFVVGWVTLGSVHEDGVSCGSFSGSHLCGNRKEGRETRS